MNVLSTQAYFFLPGLWTTNVPSSVCQFIVTATNNFSVESTATGYKIISPSISPGNYDFEISWKIRDKNGQGDHTD